MLQFLNDYNSIMAECEAEQEETLERCYTEEDRKNDRQAEKKRALDMGMPIGEFRKCKEKFWSDKRNRPTGLWPIKILTFFIKKKMQTGHPCGPHTTWTLPNGYKLTYTDYCHDWSLDDSDDIESKCLVNSVYCKKGLLYKYLCNYMMREAIRLRNE